LLGQIDDIATDTEFNGIRVLSSGADGHPAGGRLPEPDPDDPGQRAHRRRDIGISTVALSVASPGGGSPSAPSTSRSAASTRSAARSVPFQNRLEFTINTLAIQEENSASSESAIRDADIAQETIGFTRNQILVSAGTSVLAQANVVPQTALQLLG
jgi:flagellin